VKLPPFLALLLISTCALTVLSTLPALAQKVISQQQPQHSKPSPETLIQRLTRTLLEAAKPRLAHQKEQSPPDVVLEAAIQGDMSYSRTGTVNWTVTTDLQKTHSPTAPYLGLVTHTMESKRTPEYLYATRAEAEQAPLTKVVDFDVILTFVYQNSKWVYQGVHKGPMRRK
jgi:hypothetical protein